MNPHIALGETGEKAARPRSLEHLKRLFATARIEKQVDVVRVDTSRPAGNARA